MPWTGYFGNTNNQLMKSHKNGERNHEYNAALRFVKPSLRKFRLELRNNPGECHAAGIRSDCNGNG